MNAHNQFSNNTIGDQSRGGSWQRGRQGGRLRCRRENEEMDMVPNVALPVDSPERCYWYGCDSALVLASGYVTGGARGSSRNGAGESTPGNAVTAKAC